LRGSTPTELLIAALVVIILLIAASPFYCAARSEAGRLRCETARRLIADAQEQYRQRSGAHAYARDPGELAALLPNPPSCPAGGHYKFRVSDELDRHADGSLLGPGRLVILCTAEGHEPFVLPAPDED